MQARKLLISGPEIKVAGELLTAAVRQNTT